MDVSFGGVVRRVSVDRGDEQHTIDDELVTELHTAMDDAEADDACRVVVLVSGAGIFSTGMNLTVAAGEASPRGAAVGQSSEEAGGAFFDLLHRFTSSPRIVVAAVDGRVAGGGVGLVAASDLVYATDRSTFALPEALWGLLPCCVLPYLIRRVGFQRAYAMALTTQPLESGDALAVGLCDAVGDIDSLVRRLAFRAAKLDPETIRSLKRYAAALWDIPDDIRRLAVDELGRLMALPAVRGRLTAFATHGRFPWEG